MKVPVPWCVVNIPRISSSRYARTTVFGLIARLTAIIADAKVNLAAIHYHYRSKEALFDAVILRRLEPINRERLAILDAYEQPTLEQVLEAFLAPAFRVGADPDGGPTFVRLMGRIFWGQTSGFFPLVEVTFGVVVGAVDRG